MTEFMQDNAKIYQYSGDGKTIRVNTVAELIPFAIRGEQIK